MTGPPVGRPADVPATELGASFGVPTGVRRIVAPTDGSTRMVLVRHGEAVCNVNGIVGGVIGCTGLTELGRRQISALAARLEVTGELKKEKEAKTATARTLWVPAVNNHGGFGRWAFLEVTDPYDDVAELIRAVAGASRDERDGGKS